MSMNAKIRNFFLGSFLIILIGVLFSASSAEAVGKRSGPKATLTLVKTVINDNSGTKQVGDFTLQIDGQIVQSGVPKTLAAGVHIASEISIPGYSASVWGGDCTSDGSITLQRKQNAICTITNDDVEPSILQDNFNVYTDGSIVGQGVWNNRVNGSNFVVQGTTVFEGVKAIHNNAQADSVITKIGSPLSNGRQAVYKTENRNNWGEYPDGNVQVRIAKGGWDSSTMASVTFKKGGNVAYYDPALDTYTNFDIYNDNEWTLVEVEWRSSDRTARYRVNNGMWTDWLAFKGASSFTNFDNVGLAFVLPSGSGGVYFDTLH